MRHASSMRLHAAQESAIGGAATWEAATSDAATWGDATREVATREDATWGDATRGDATRGKANADAKREETTQPTRRKQLRTEPDDATPS